MLTPSKQCHSNSQECTIVIPKHHWSSCCGFIPVNVRDHSRLHMYIDTIQLKVYRRGLLQQHSSALTVWYSYMTCGSVNAVLSESRNNARRDELFSSCCDCSDNQHVFLTISLFLKALFCFVLTRSVWCDYHSRYRRDPFRHYCGDDQHHPVLPAPVSTRHVPHYNYTHLIQHKCHNSDFLCHLIITLRWIANIGCKLIYMSKQRLSIHHLILLNSLMTKWQEKISLLSFGQGIL